MENFIFCVMKEFKFQTDVYKGCHDVLMMYMNLCNITILYIHDTEYRCIIGVISRSEAVY